MLHLIFSPPQRETSPGGCSAWELCSQAGIAVLRPWGRLTADVLAVPLSLFALFILQTNDTEQF